MGFFDNYADTSSGGGVSTKRPRMPGAVAAPQPWTAEGAMSTPEASQPFKMPGVMDVPAAPAMPTYPESAAPHPLDKPETGSGPVSPVDMMLGKYNEAEKRYTDLMSGGPEQFHPSIWRRLAGFGLGTLAGMGGGRQGVGKYAGLYTSADPRESENVAHKFTFGPQGKMNEDFQRKLLAAKEGVAESRENVRDTRQEGIDDMSRRNILSEIENRNKPSVSEGYRIPQDGGPAQAIPIDESSLPEGFGPEDATTLPEVMRRKELAPLEAAEARQADRDKVADDRLNKTEKFSQEQQARMFAEQEKLANMRDKRGDDKTARRMMLAASLPTNAEKVEYTRAGSLQDFADDLTQKINSMADKFGPGSGRYNQFMTGRVGAKDPDFSRFLTESHLAATRMMQFHAGNRPAQQLIQQFLDMLNSKQAPQNLLGNIDEIRKYATRVTQGYESKMQNAADYGEVDNPVKPRSTAAPTVSGGQGGGGTFKAWKSQSKQPPPKQ